MVSNAVSALGCAEHNVSVEGIKVAIKACLQVFCATAAKRTDNDGFVNLVDRDR
jgi:hypothetical protein